MRLESAPQYARPVPLDKLSRDVESLAEEVIESRSGDTLIFYAGNMNPMSGSPAQSSLGNAGVAPAWGLAKSTVTTVGLMTKFPADWATYKIILLGAPRDGTGGDVAFRHARSNGGVGDSFLTGTITGSVVTSAMGSTAGVLLSVEIASGLAVPASGKYVGIQIARRVAEAGDTYSGTFDLGALVLSRAS